MSSSPARKRKHAHDESSPSKKRKHAHNNELEATDSKKSRKRRVGQQDKTRHEFAHVEASLVVAVPPVFANNLAQGVEEMLDSMLMRYIPPLRGVVLAHSNLRFLDSKAEIQDDSPFAVCRVAFDATVWSPRVGQQLTGHITLSSPDHVALLVHHIFNAAIPAAHLPREQWEFVPGDAADDEAAMGEGEEEDAGAGENNTSTTTPGHWVHTHTREPLGGPDRMLSFTVVKLTIANQMLSLVGSIRPDPFAPVPQEANPVEDDIAASPPAPEEDQELLAITRRAEKKKRKKEKEKRKEERAKRKEEKQKRKTKMGLGESEP